MASIYGFEGTRSWPTALFQRLKCRVGTLCDSKGWTAGDTSRQTVHSSVLLAIPLQQPAMRHASAFQAAHGGRQWRIRTNQELSMHYKILKWQYILKGLESLRHMIRTIKRQWLTKCLKSGGGMRKVG